MTYLEHIRSMNIRINECYNPNAHLSWEKEEHPYKWKERSENDNTKD